MTRCRVKKKKKKRIEKKKKKSIKIIFYSHYYTACPGNPGIKSSCAKCKHLLAGGRTSVLSNLPYQTHMVTRPRTPCFIHNMIGGAALFPPVPTNPVIRETGLLLNISPKSTCPPLKYSIGGERYRRSYLIYIKTKNKKKTEYTILMKKLILRV